jgi:uncharacterized protein (DUF1697 family)
VARYAALLRGVNVAGNKLAMAELVRIVESSGGRRVRTYLQSGNVVFDGAKRLATELERSLLDELGVRSPVLVRSAAELARVVEAKPFAADGKAVSVTFLASTPSAAAVRSIDPSAYADDRFARRRGVPAHSLRLRQVEAEQHVLGAEAVDGGDDPELEHRRRPGRDDCLSGQPLLPRGRYRCAPTRIRRANPISPAPVRTQPSASGSNTFVLAGIPVKGSDDGGRTTFFPSTVVPGEGAREVSVGRTDAPGDDGDSVGVTDAVAVTVGVGDTVSVTVGVGDGDAAAHVSQNTLNFFVTLLCVVFLPVSLMPVDVTETLTLTW